MSDSTLRKAEALVRAATSDSERAHAYRVLWAELRSDRPEQVRRAMRTGGVFHYALRPPLPVVSAEAPAEPSTQLVTFLSRTQADERRGVLHYEITCAHFVVERGTQALR